MFKKIIYDSIEVSREFPLNYSEIQGKELFISKYDKLPKVHSCQLNKALVSPYGIVYERWKVVHESVFEAFSNQNNYFTLFKKVLLNKVKKVKGLSVIGTHAYYLNYYHFTSECLPRLFLMKEYANEAQVLVHENLPDFAREYIRLLGFTKIVDIKDNELAKVEKLVFATHVANIHGHNPQVLSELVPFLKSRINMIDKDYSIYRNLYVSRRKASVRRLTNEDDLIKLLKEHEFEVIYLEDYSIEEQIAIFSNVKNLIAVHGAGITNIMYMQEGGLIIELINEKHYAPFFYNLANIFKHDTVYIQGSANPDTQDPIRDNFEVELHKLKFCLDNYLK